MQQMCNASRRLALATPKDSLYPIKIFFYRFDIDTSFVYLLAKPTILFIRIVKDYDTTGTPVTFLASTALNTLHKSRKNKLILHS